MAFETMFHMLNGYARVSTSGQTLVLHWMAKEMSRVIKDNDPEPAGVDISLITHISPIEWSNVILYGEYKLNRDMMDIFFVIITLLRANLGGTLCTRPSLDCTSKGRHRRRTDNWQFSKLPFRR